MEIKPIGVFHSPFDEKFGCPRQSGLVKSLGEIHFNDEFKREEAVKGLEGFDYLWLLWAFDRNPQTCQLTVRPPRLGGNEAVGVFASRSPFRPNGIALSSVRLLRIDKGPVIVVEGADLADGTAIYDIKPYIPYTDCHQDARAGFTDTASWHELSVVFDGKSGEALPKEDISTLEEVLRQDPRPHYQNDDTKVYGMSFKGHNVRFRVSGGVAHVLEISR